jgi:hypothetical protein
LGFGISDLGFINPKSEIRIPKSQMVMAAIVQRLERQIVVLDVVGSIPTSRPITLQAGNFLAIAHPTKYNQVSF